MKKLISLLCVMVTLCVFAVACTSLPKTKPQESGDTEFSVTFDADNGITNEPIKVKKGQKIPKPENPVKQSTATEEYEFLGWYNGNVLWNFDTDVVSKAITLKAKWQAKPIAQMITYAVTFDSAGGSAVEQQSVDEGGKVIKPSDPTRASTATEEYEFLGWYNGDVLWDFENAVNENITLKAKWKEVKYTGEYLPLD